MARIDRKTQKIFAGGAANNGQFGSAQTGAKVLSNDLDTIQALTAWVNGWNDATISGQKLPTLEEMQGLQYVVTSQLAYLFERGFAEYDAGTNYFIDSLVMKVGTFEIYKSLTDDNIGNALTDVVEWELLIDLANPASASNFVWGGVASGTNTVTLTPTETQTAYADGTTFTFIPANNNTGAATLNVDALGAIDILKESGLALVDNDIVTDKPCLVTYYDGDFYLNNPAIMGVGADIASASTVNLTATTGKIIDITGTTGISAVTLPEGEVRIARFTAALTLTDGASLVLPSGANITTAAGDIAIFIGYASGVVRVIYQKADGTPLVSNVDAEQLATSWVNWNGSGTVAIRDSYNVSSITDISTGVYTVNIDTDLADANYAISALFSHTSGLMPYIVTGTAPTAAAYRVANKLDDGGAIDSVYCSSSTLGGN